MATKADESKLTPVQREVLGLLRKGKSPEQIAQRRKTSTNAIYQTVRRLRAAGFDYPGANATQGNGGGARRSSRKARRGNRRRATPRTTPAPPAPPEPHIDVSPAARISEAKQAVEAERTTLAKEQDNLRAERDRLLAEAEAHGKTIGDIDTGIARLDHVLEEFDAKVEVAS